MHLGRSGKAYPHIQPSKRSVKRINAKLTELTTRNLTPIPLPIIVKPQDPTLTCGACRNPLIRLTFRKITHHQQGDYMIFQNAIQTK